MVIKTYTEHWHTYAEQSGLSGVMFEVSLDYRDSYMLFGKHRTMMKIARLLGIPNGGNFIVDALGPIRGHLCR